MTELRHFGPIAYDIAGLLGLAYVLAGVAVAVWVYVDARREWLSKRNDGIVLAGMVIGFVLWPVMLFALTSDAVSRRREADQP